MGFMLHLIYFDSSKIPGLVICLDAVKTQARVEKRDDVVVKATLTASQRSFNFAGDCWPCRGF